MTLSAARPEVGKRRERLGLSISEIVQANLDDSNDDDDEAAAADSQAAAGTVGPASTQAGLWRFKEKEVQALAALGASGAAVEAYVVATPEALLPW